jgi:hypothetical protein
MDLSKLTNADKMLFGGGIVFLISTFFNWFTVSFAGITAGGNGWEVGFLWGRLPALIVIAMLVWIGLKYWSSVKLPDQIKELFLAGGAAVALLPLLKFIIGEDDPLKRAFGLFLAVVSGLVFGFGALKKFTEVGGDLDVVKSQLKSKADELRKND